MQTPTKPKRKDKYKNRNKPTNSWPRHLERTNAKRTLDGLPPLEYQVHGRMHDTVDHYKSIRSYGANLNQLEKIKRAIITRLENRLLFLDDIKDRTVKLNMINQLLCFEGKGKKWGKK